MTTDIIYQFILTIDRGVALSIFGMSVILEGMSTGFIVISTVKWDNRLIQSIYRAYFDVIE